MMPTTRTNVDYAKRIFRERLGNDYVYASVWSKTDTEQGCDCSALVAHELNAVLYGPNMQWNRVDPTQGNAWITTESWRPIEVGQRGPFGTITVAGPQDFPADAVVKICLHHGEGGGANSHMNCTVDGLIMESNGDDGCVTAPQAIPVTSTYWNDWAYLPGPIGGGGELAGVDVDRLNKAVDKILAEWGSRSIYRSTDDKVDDTVGMLLNTDGSLHELITEHRALLLNDPVAIALVRATASGTSAGSKLHGKPNADAVARAQRVLAKIGGSGAPATTGAAVCALSGGACALVAQPK